MASRRSGGGGQSQDRVGRARQGCGSSGQCGSVSGSGGRGALPGAGRVEAAKAVAGSAAAGHRGPGGAEQQHQERTALAATRCLAFDLHGNDEGAQPFSLKWRRVFIASAPGEASFEVAQPVEQAPGCQEKGEEVQEGLQGPEGQGLAAGLGRSAAFLLAPVSKKVKKDKAKKDKKRSRSPALVD